MEIFCSWEAHPQALTIDALTIPWNRKFAYAFPLICLIPRVLEHMKQTQYKLILITLQWPRRHWYTALLQMCIAQPIRLPAGRLNILPYQLSRVVIRQTDWEMNDMVLHQIFQIWGKPLVDLFASYQNRKMEIFCSWEVHPQALTIDALTIPWNRKFAYAFPPICLIPRVLEHMKQTQCKLILIALQRPRRHWYTALLQMCIAQPIRLPLRPDLLRQPKTIIYQSGSVQPQCMAIDKQFGSKGFS